MNNDNYNGNGNLNMNNTSLENEADVIDINRKDLSFEEQQKVASGLQQAINYLNSHGISLYDNIVEDNSEENDNDTYNIDDNLDDDEEDDSLIEEDNSTSYDIFN